MELENFKFEKIDSYELLELINESSQEVIDLAEKIKEKTQNDLSNDCSEEQLKFYNDCSKLIFGELKDKSPILIPAKCGFGKTTFLKSMIVTLIQEINNNNLSEDYLPMIITQERLEDLEKLTEDIKKETGTDNIYLFKGWNSNFNGCLNITPPQTQEEHLIKCNKLNCEQYNDCSLSHQLKKSKEFPIVAITTARLALLNNSIDSRNSLDNYVEFIDKNGNSKKRQRIIIDEKPKLLETKEFSKSIINNLESHVEKFNRYNYSEKFDREEEVYLKQQLNTIATYLLEIEAETLNESYKLISPDKSKYTKEFKDKWLELVGYKHPDFQKLDMFFNGLVLRCRDNNRFYIIEQNDFYTSGLKTFIFDGTAEISIEYKSEKNDFKYLKIDDYKDYTHLNFHVIKTYMGRNKLNEKKDLIVNWIKENFNETTFVITYKQYEKYFRNEFQENSNIVLDNGTFPYFGNTKGKNKWAECNKMVQIGWNRHSSDDYLADFLAINPVYASLWYNLYGTEGGLSQFFIEQMTPDNHGNFSHNEEIYYYVLQSMVVDLEQEVYRTKLREFSSTDPIDVYIFVKEKEYKIIKKMIEARFKNCNFIETDVNFTSGRKKQNILERNGNGKLIELFNYLDNEWDGKEILASVLYKKFNMNKNQWDYHFGGKEKRNVSLLKDRKIRLYKKNKKIGIKGKWYLKK